MSTNASNHHKLNLLKAVNEALHLTLENHDKLNVI